MTKTITIAQARACHPLAPAVLRQLGGARITREAIDTAIEAASHGADTGWPGFTYYADTVAFARRNLLGITIVLDRMAEDLGERGPVSLVLGFRCIKDAGMTEAQVASVIYGKATGGDADIVYNALAWFALEEVGHAIESEGDR